jgi:hypothetical protein
MKILNNYVKGAAFMALAALTSCASGDFETPANEDVKAIDFATYLQTSSRGTDVTTAALQSSGFSVVGYQTLSKKFADFISANSSAAADFMVKQGVTYDSSKKAWGYTPVQYWPTNTAYRISFFGYGPTNKVAADNVTTTGAPKVKYDIKPASGTSIAADAAYDLVAATKTDAAYFEDGGKVAFTFSHVLSRLGITVKTSEDRTNTNVYVTDVKINGNQCNLTGTYNIYDNSWSEKAPAGTTAYSLSNMLNKATANGVTGVAVTSTKASVFKANEYLFMVPTFTKATSATQVPAATSDDFVVEIEYAVVTSDNATILKDSGRFDLNTQFLQGKAYTLNFSVSLASNQIVFDSITVDGWTNNTTGSNGDTSTDNSGSDTDTSDPEVFTDYYLFGDDSSLTWHAQEANRFVKDSDGSYYLKNVSFSDKFMIGETNSSSSLWGLPIDSAKNQYVEVKAGGTYTLKKGDWTALNYNRTQTYSNVTLKFTPDENDETATLEIIQNQ